MIPVHVVLSVAVSVDGYLDDRAPERLVLSDPADLDAVDELRASCDALLVGAGTVRADDPRLLVRSPDRVARRIADGRTPQPMKLTVTRSGELSPQASFFTVGETRKVVLCGSSSAKALADRVGALAEVVPLPEEIPLAAGVLERLSDLGVERLLVEGGSRIATSFLEAGAVDEVRMAVAPFFVGDAEAPRFTRPARFPHHSRERMQLAAMARLGDTAVIWYRLRRSV